jgi:gluconokinase
MPKRHPELLVLALDIGTSSTRAALFNRRAQRLAQRIAAKQYTVAYGSDGRAELAPATVLGAVKTVLHECLRPLQSVPAGRRPPLVIAGSALWHGLLGLNHRLQPITPIFTWADSRAAAAARGLRSQFDEGRVHQRTGCLLRASYWPAKLIWLKRSQPKLFHRVAYWVSPSDWLFYRIFGELRTSASMASGTGLYRLDSHTWDDQLLSACEIKAAQLPSVGDSFTQTGADWVNHVYCAIGDGAASNLGSGADRPLVTAINVGTSAAVRTVLPCNRITESLPFGLFRYAIDHQHHLVGGAISNAGNLRQWCLRTLRLPADEGALDRLLSRDMAATDSLTVLPFLVQERAPTWPENVPGVIWGLEQGTNPGQIARASATAVFYRLGQIIDEMESWLGRLTRIVVSGGIVRSPATIALLADAIGRGVGISAEPEASLRGAAVYALKQLGQQISGPRPKVVRHNRRLARLHRVRCKRQVKLERTMKLNPLI